MADLSINLAQQLINTQFPAINGFQSTLLQNKPRIGAAPMDQLEIIHSRGDYWIVASTVGSSGDEVCDSVYNTLDQTTLDVIIVIANLFHSSTVNSGALRHGTRKVFHKQMHMHISVHSSCSLQHMELKINSEIQEGSLYLTTNSVAMETLVMGVSNNYSMTIVNFFKHGALNHRGRLQRRYLLL